MTELLTATVITKITKIALHPIITKIMTKNHNKQNKFKNNKR